MGSVKEHWLGARPDYQLAFECPVCSFVCASNERLPDIPGRYGPEDSIETAIPCARCKTSFEVEVSTSYEGHIITVVDHPEVVVTKALLDYSDDYNEWDDSPDPEPRAYAFFNAALGEWWTLLQTMGDKADEVSSVNRMLFTQLFSILEAYLSDEIVGLALRNTEVQRAVISCIPALSKHTVGLDKIVENADYVRDTVKTTMQALSFHKLDMVNSITLKALAQPLLPSDAADRLFLMGAVEARHDCVHRNGRDKAGKTVEVKVEWLMELSKKLEGMARSIQQRVHHIDGHRMANEHFSQLDLSDLQK